MSWTYNTATSVWTFSRYEDLDSTAVNNLSVHGQPHAPGEIGYREDLTPDFANIVVETSHLTILRDGYGKNVTASDFPLVQTFLDGGGPAVAGGSKLLGQLMTAGLVANGDRFISTTFYGTPDYGVTPGSIGAADAAYVHGSVSFALMRETRFLETATERRVEAVIGVGNDNWDFESDNVPGWLNGLVRFFRAPSGYQLENPITFRFTGSGKSSTARQSRP